MSDFELIAVRRAIEEPDAAAIAMTATGPVWMSVGFLNTVAPEAAWAGLQDLHYRAAGEESPELTGMAEGMTPEQAWDQYSSGVGSVLGQLGCTGPDAGSNILGSLNDYAHLTGSIDGLESPFLAAFSSAARDHASPALKDGAAILNDLGIPSTLGGGAQAALTFDVPSGKMALHDAQTLSRVFGLPSLGVEAVVGGLISLVDHASSGSPGSTVSAAASEVKGAVHVLGEVGTAMATGFAIGGPLAPAFAFGFAVLAIFGLIAESSTHEAHQAKQAAEGHAIAVERTEVVPKGEPQKALTVSPDGTPSHTITATPAPAPSSNDPKKCVAPPDPAKCWRDEDGTFNPEFALPYWQDSTAMMPTALARGPGLDAQVNLLGGEVLQFTNLPSVDASGIAEEGILAAVLTSDWQTIPVGKDRITVGPRRLAIGGRELVVEIRTPQGMRPLVIRVPTE